MANIFNTTASFYDIFIKDKVYLGVPSDFTDHLTSKYRELLIACYNSGNYDEPYKIPEFDGELTSFKKCLEEFNKKDSYRIRIGVGKKTKWYYQPICTVIMGYYIGVREARDPNIDWNQRSMWALQKIRDLLEMHSQVKKVNAIKLLYNDPRNSRARNSYKYAFNYDRYPSTHPPTKYQSEVNYLEFLFLYSEGERNLCNSLSKFTKDVANMFFKYGIVLTKKKNLMEEFLYGENEDTIVSNLKLYNSVGGDLNINEEKVLVNAIRHRQENVILYLLKKGYSLNFQKKNWVHTSRGPTYPQDVQTAAIMYGMINVLKYCVEERKINYFKQYRENTFQPGNKAFQNHRLLHVAVFNKKIDAIDYLLSKNEDLSFKGECEFSPGEMAVMLAASGEADSVFYQLLDKPKMSYVQYKNLVGEGEQYYTDEMDCPVCMDAFGAQEIIIFSCGHAICKDCFGELAQRNSKCPICRAELDVKLRVKLELGTRKLKSKGKSKKKLRKAKSLPNLKRRISSNSNTSIYSANNNSKQGSRSSSRSSNRSSSRSSNRKSKKGKKGLRRVLSDNLTNFELVSEAQILAEEERGKRSVRNKSVKLFQREERNEALNNLRGRLNKKKLGRSPTQKYRKGKLFPSPVTPKKKASKKAKSAPVAAAAKPRTPSPPRDFSAAPRRSGRERKPVKY